MKLRFAFVVFSILNNSCNDNECLNLSIDIQEQIVEFEKTQNDSVIDFSTYYFNGIKRSNGKLLNGLKNGIWTEYDSKGNLIWEAYFWKGDRYISNKVRMATDTMDLEYKNEHAKDGFFCENSIEYFNVIFQGFHSDDFSFINLKNCNITRCNNLTSGGFDFKIEVFAGDSIYFEVCADVFGDDVSFLYDSERIQKCTQ